MVFLLVVSNSVERAGGRGVANPAADSLLPSGLLSYFLDSYSSSSRRQKGSWTCCRRFDLVGGRRFTVLNRVYGIITCWEMLQGVSHQQ